MKPLVKRQKITAATKQRFEKRAFRWGYSDCGRILAWHLNRFGHKPPKAGGYTTALGAKKRLIELGYANMTELMDDMGLEVIGLARALPGDIVAFSSDDPVGAIGIVVGNGNMLAFHEDHDLPVIMTMGKIDRAWSVM